jgi:hypothetical protein
MSFATEIVLRVFLVISLNDAIILYVITRRGRPLTVPIVIGLILITVISLLINLFYCFSRWGIK